MEEHRCDGQRLLVPETQNPTDILALVGRIILDQVT